MSPRTKQSVLHGAFILVAATVVVKLIGAVFKIPLTNIIGGEGMGYFGTAYGLFNPIYALSVAGLPVAVSKMVAENVAHKRYRDARKIMQLSCLIFFVVGAAGFAIMILGSGIFVRLVGNPDAFWSVVAISPAIFFGCVMSSYRGYYEGLRNMYPTAWSQIIEAIAKLAFGLGGAALVMKVGMMQYDNGGVVFGTVVSSFEAAKRATLPFASAAAIAGVSVSTFAGMVYLWLSHKRKKDGITKQELMMSPPARPSKVLVRRLIGFAIPVCLGALVSNLTSLIDLASVMNRLATAISNDAQAVLSMHAGMIPEGMELSDIPNYLFGSYQGLAINVFNLVPAITSTFGISALPAVASSWAIRDLRGTKKNIEAMLKLTALVAIPAGLGLFALSEPILALLYSSRPQEVAIATPLLSMMGISVIFVSIAMPVYSMLQGIGRADVPVKLMAVGGVIKLITNFILVAIPSINIHGAPIGSILCYGLICIASIVVLCRETGVVPNFFTVFIKPLIAAGFCIVAAYASQGLISHVISPKIATILGIGLGAVVYVVVLFLIRAISKEDILMMPKGEKIYKILEKRGIMR